MSPPPPKARLAWTPLTRVLAVIAVVGLGAGLVQLVRPLWNAGTRAAGVDGAGPPAPDFSLEDLSGRPVKLSDFRGQSVVVLDFWATWCGPCRASLPELNDLRQRYRGKGVEVLSVNQREDPATVKSFLDQQRLDLWVLLDALGAASRLYNVQGIPTMVVIDKDGAVRKTIVGYAPGVGDQIEQAVKALL